MPQSDRLRPNRAVLNCEALEDRTTPVGGMSLTAQANAGFIAPDRLIVVLPSNNTNILVGTPSLVQTRSLGNGIYGLRFAAGTNLDTAIARLARLPGVASAEPDQIVRPDARPNDASYNLMYGPAKIGAEAVWNRTTGNPNFIVGLLDSGLDYTHPDIAANIWTNPGEIAGNGVDDDRNGFIDDIRGWDFANDDNDPMDDDGHGTHVAGTVGAVGNNGVGVTGISWSVKLMAVPFLGTGPNSGLLSSAIGALNYSITMGAKLTNNSWGSNAGGLSAAFGRTLARAQSVGQIFVSSAGNIGANNDLNPNRFPSNYTQFFDNVIAVAATDINDNIADFSNFGARTVTLGAPGVNVYSTMPGNTYDFLDGTSMATPHVTGSLALYWGANPTLSYKQVLNVLKRSVDLVPSLAGKTSTGGRLNVAKMFTTSLVPPVVVGAPEGSEIVRVLGPGGNTQLALAPHPGFLGGIVAASGDVTGDGVADVATSATFGGHLKVVNGATGTEAFSFYAFEGYQGPINIAIGDLTGDGIGDVIVAANLNGHVKVFDGLTGQLRFSQLVYNGYFGAITVSAGDIDGDGFNELITAGNGGAGVHVKAFNPFSLELRESFFATEAGPWPDFSVAAVDLDLDGIAELLVSQGPRVRVIESRSKAVRADFLAFDPLTQDRFSVQAGAFTGDLSPELVVVRQVGGRSEVRVFDGRDFAPADTFFADTR